MDLVEILAGLSAMIADTCVEPTEFGYDFTSLVDEVRIQLIEEEPDATVADLVAELVGDPELRRFVDTRFGPPKVAVNPADQLRSAHFESAVEFRDLAQESSIVLIGLSLAGAPLTAAFFIHLVGGPAIEDLMISTAATRDILRGFDTAGDLIETGRAGDDLVTLLTDAMALAKMASPPPASASWPDQVVLAEWVIRQLPGRACETDWEPSLTSDDVDALCTQFLTTDDGRRSAIPDRRVAAAVDTIMRFKLHYGSDAPMLWGPQQVDYLLGDWVLRKVVGSRELVVDIVEVLPDWIRFCHARAGVSAAVTDNALRVHGQLAAITLGELDNPRRRSGAQTEIDAFIENLRASGLLPADDATRWWQIRAVGSEEALETLDTEPLPTDEALDLSKVPSSARDDVAHIAKMAVGIARHLGNDELATATGRIAAWFGEEIPSTITKGRAESAAAAIVLIACAVNPTSSRGITQKAIADRAGTSTNYTDRCRTFCRHVDSTFSSYETHLGIPRFLTASQRAEILSMGDG